MNLKAGILSPLGQVDGRRTAFEVYEVLQDAILSGRIKPDTILSQVDVANELNVSRTPVREAMRKLQEAGLISDEPNLRSRVLAFDPRDIEALYAKRIMMESLGVALTALSRPADLLLELQETVEALEGEEAHRDFDIWKDLHRRLHRLMVGGAGDTYGVEVQRMAKRSEGYQSAHKGQHMPGWWLRGEDEHRKLLGAIFAGDGAEAGELAARHLARTALELIAALAPEYNPTCLRASLQYAISGAKALVQ